MQSRVPLNQSPIWGLEADNRCPSGFEPGVAIDPPDDIAAVDPTPSPRSPVSDSAPTILGMLNRIAEGIERLGQATQASPSASRPPTFGERRNKPITLGDWLQARGQATITLTRFDAKSGAYTAARFDLVLRNLLPHSVYITFAIRQASFLPASHPYYRLPDPLGMPNVFVTDGHGNARLSYEVPHPFPDPSDDPKFLRVIGLAVSYKSDYQNWGGRNGLLGPGLGVHIAFNTFADGTFDLAQRFPVLRTTAPQNPVDKALAGIGGASALTALTSFSIDSTGSRFEPGEVPAPGDISLLVSEFTLAVHYDVASDQFRLNWHRPVYYPEAVTTTYSAIVSGERGYIDGRDAGPVVFPADYAMISTRVASDRKQQYLLNPQLILRALAEDPSRARLQADQVYEDRLHHVISVPGLIQPILLFVDADTGLLSKLSTTESDYANGNNTLEVRFKDWTLEGDSLRFPMALEIWEKNDPQQRQALIHREERTTVVVNPILDPQQFTLPKLTTPDEALTRQGDLNSQWYQRFIGLGFPLDVDQTFIQAQTVSPGVHFLGGGTHNSLAIELAESVVVFDAPLYEARSLAVIDWVKEHCGGKPITHVLHLHFHKDHSGGLRTYVTIGAIIITSTSGLTFTQRMLTAAHSVYPDLLEQNPREAVIDPLTAAQVYRIQDPTNPIEIRHVTAFHATDLLMAYLPQTKLLFNVDLWAPGQIPRDQPLPEGFYADGAANLYAALQRYDLDVQTIAGGHGGVGPYRDLVERIDG